ncbi:hypothetical protein [Clostridium celatum]|jgi:hypothetical protein|uniref:hypothetical protein n=1 Tax=Clostridium celatum TaxID=36834 RepID=UPI0018993AE1|nr:hypothetical protein [Clostridium celatum]MDY3359868.1 hypothetical protein [Clostridium celatum]
MKKFILMIVTICLLLVGCNKNSDSKSINQASGTVTEIRFKDMIDVEELRKLDGTKVKITGFMAQSSPLDGSMIYLMNMPYQSCVYCLPNTNQLVNTMAVYPKEGKKIEFSDLAVEVVGEIKFEDITDEMGYSYSYRIVNAQLKEADVESLTEEAKLYTQLVDRGFVDAISNVILEANTIINYEKIGLSTTDIDKISDDLIKTLDDTFDGLDKGKYTDILEQVESLKGLVVEINDLIEAGNYSKLSSLQGRDLDVFYAVYEWLMKPEL